MLDFSGNVLPAAPRRGKRSRVLVKSMPIYYNSLVYFLQLDTSIFCFSSPVFWNQAGGCVHFCVLHPNARFTAALSQSSQATTYAHTAFPAGTPAVRLSLPVEKSQMDRPLRGLLGMEYTTVYTVYIIICGCFSGGATV